MLELNELYTEPEMLDRIKGAYEKNASFPNIKLADFFVDPYELSDKIALLGFRKERDPLHHSFEQADVPTELIGKLQVALVPLLNKFNLTSLKQAVAYRLTHKSYSMLTDVDETDAKKTVDIIIDVSEEWDEGFGGDIVYIDSEGEPLEVEPSDNTVIVVQKKPQTRHFFKYCNHYSKDYERMFIVMTFRDE